MTIILAILQWFLSPVGKVVAIVVAVTVALGGVYVKGRIDGKAAYQAKLTREINTAIKKGDDARVDALKKFDANKEIEDDGFARD